MTGNNIIETISNIFVIIGVAWAFIEYRMQKINELKSAFTIIVNQIDNIEDKINFLLMKKAEKDMTNNVIFRCLPIVTNNEWNLNKHIIVKKLNSTDIKILDDFYSTVEQIESSREALERMLKKGWESKATITQEVLSELLKDPHITPEEAEKNYKFYRYDNLNYIYTPKVPLDIIIESLEVYKPISHSVTYCKLKKYSYNK